jgi:predicted Ser/Thr protein kinase
MTGAGARPGLGPAPAAVVGRYRLLRELGAGGMGVVHLGMDADDRVAAVKVLRPHVAVDPDARARLAREAAALRRLRHPRVAEIVDVELSGPHPYVAMRYIPGPPLESVVREHGPLAGGALAALLWGLLEAVAVIHAAGLVHRDIKPTNVLLLDGEPVVIDFGIARALDDATVTMTGTVVGTPGYLAPELLAGGEPSRSADWWGWAAVGAFAATGRPPFGRGPTELVLDRIRRGEADLDRVPASLGTLLRAGLQPDPSRRPAPDELRAGLAAAVGPPPAPAAATARLAAAPAAAPPPPTVPAPVMPAPGHPAPSLAAGRSPAAGARAVTSTRMPPAGPRPAPADPRPPVAPPAPSGYGPAPYPPSGVRPTRAYPAPPYQGPGRSAGPVPVRHPPPHHPAPPGAPPAGAGRPPPTGAPTPRAAGWAGLQWAWLAAVVVAAVVTPTGVLVLGLVWSAVARSIEWSRVARAREAWTAASLGRPPGSAATLVVLYPVRLVGAFGVSLLYVLPVVAGAALAVWARDAVPGAFAGLGTGTFALLMSALVVASAWWGVGGAAVRHGTRHLTAPVTRTSTGRWIWLSVAGLVAIAALLVLADSGPGAQWSPGWTLPGWLGPLLWAA